MRIFFWADATLLAITGGMHTKLGHLKYTPSNLEVSSLPKAATRS